MFARRLTLQDIGFTKTEEEPMLTKAGLEFLLRITDYFHGHWEDPGWGHRPANQVLILSSVQTLAGGIADEGVRRQVLGTLEKAMVSEAQKTAKALS